MVLFLFSFLPALLCAQSTDSWLSLKNVLTYTTKPFKQVLSVRALSQKILKNLTSHNARNTLRCVANNYAFYDMLKTIKILHIDTHPLTIFYNEIQLENQIIIKNT